MYAASLQRLLAAGSVHCASSQDLIVPCRSFSRKNAEPQAQNMKRESRGLEDHPTARA